MRESFDDYLKNHDDKRLCEEERALKYKYLGKEDEAKRLFEVTTTIRVPQSKFDERSEEDKTDIDMMIGQSNWQMAKGIAFSLAGKDPQKARELFEWASENAYVSQEQLAILIKNEWFDRIALAHLWRGYALLMLGKYDKACVLLKEVVPYFNKWKKSGGSVYQNVEYLLPKALVPLCEYKLHPSADNKHRAIEGLKAFIDSFKNYAERLHELRYYYHLKESFPDVYQMKDEKTTTGNSVKIPVSMKGLPPTEYDTKGSVIVFEKGSGCLEVIGSNNEFEDYVENVKSLGDYPAISQLTETYALDEEQEPEPLIEECINLLSQPGLGTSIRQITEYVLEVAKCAKNSEDKVILYFDKNIE